MAQPYRHIGRSRHSGHRLGGSDERARSESLAPVSEAQRQIVERDSLSATPRCRLLPALQRLRD